MLSAAQLRFLAARVLAETDKEAAEQCGLLPDRVAFWKRNTEFAERYEAVFSDGVQLALDYTRKLLGKAASRLDDELDAERVRYVEVKGEDAGSRTEIKEPDWAARHKAIETVLKVQGLLRERIDVMLVEQEAERMATLYGLDKTEVLAEARELLGLRG